MKYTGKPPISFCFHENFDCVRVLLLLAQGHSMINRENSGCMFRISSWEQEREKGWTLCPQALGNLMSETTHESRSSDAYTLTWLETWSQDTGEERQVNWDQRGHVGHSRRVGAEKEWRKGGIWMEAGAQGGRRWSWWKAEVLRHGVQAPKAKRGQRSTGNPGWCRSLSGCLSGWMCGRPLSLGLPSVHPPHFWEQDSELALGTLALLVSGQLQGYHVTQAWPIRHPMLLATVISSGMACDTVRTNQS